MKKYILFGLLFILSTLSWAQQPGTSTSKKTRGGDTDVSVLVENALANGRSEQGSGFYLIRAPKKTKIPLDDFYDYMDEHNYLLVDGSIWGLSMVKFGNRIKTISDADFLPQSEIGLYVAGIKTTNAKKGKAYILLETNSKAMDVEWDGQVSDGFIEGKGTGIAALGNGKYYVFTGKFKNGIANGNCTVTLAIAKIDDDGIFYPAATKKENVASYFVSDFVNDYAQYSKDNKWGFINKNASVIISPTYKKIVSSFGSDGYAVVMNDKDKEIKIDKNGKEAGYSDRQAEVARKRAEQEEKTRIATAEAEKRRVKMAQNYPVKKNLPQDYIEHAKRRVIPIYEKWIVLTEDNYKNMSAKERLNFLDNKMPQKSDQLLYFKRGGEPVYCKTDKERDALEGFSSSWEGKVNDSLGYISMAKDLLEVNKIVYYYKELVLYHRCGFLNMSLGHIAMYNYDKYYQREDIVQALADLYNLKDVIKTRKSPFNDFYAIVYSDVLAEKEWIDNDLLRICDKDWTTTQSVLDDIRREQRQEYMSEMCDKCKIDASKSTVPEGYIEKSWFLGTPARSKTKGEIVLQNGRIIKWWYLYDDYYGNKIEVSGNISSIYKFKNEKDMWEEIIRSCKAVYCQ